MKQAVAASTLAFFLTASLDVKRLALFSIIALVVPPPLGIVTGLAAVGLHVSCQTVARSAGRVYRDILGYAQPGDFDVLAEFNRVNREAPRLHVPVPVYTAGSPWHEKTVFLTAEMR